MNLPALLVGGTAFCAVVVIGFLARSWTARRRCPGCGTATVQTQGRVPIPSGLERRWCSACGWKGVGRSGPEFDPSLGPASHGSGFRWSTRPSANAPRFHWGARDEPAPPGFRFGDEGPSETGQPLGFQFGEADPDLPESIEQAFGWADQAEPGFQWRGGQQR